MKEDDKEKNKDARTELISTLGALAVLYMIQQIKEKPEDLKRRAESIEKSLQFLPDLCGWKSVTSGILWMYWIVSFFVTIWFQKGGWGWGIGSVLSILLGILVVRRVHVFLRTGQQYLSNEVVRQMLDRVKEICFKVLLFSAVIVGFSSYWHGKLTLASYDETNPSDSGTLAAIFLLLEPVTLAMFLLLNNYENDRSQSDEHSFARTLLGEDYMTAIQQNVRFYEEELNKVYQKLQKLQ